VNVDEISGSSIPVVIPFVEPGKPQSKMNDTNLNQPSMLKILGEIE
jgi:hypothetical protein